MGRAVLMRVFAAVVALLGCAATACAPVPMSERDDVHLREELITPTMLVVGDSLTTGVEHIRPDLVAAPLWWQHVAADLDAQPTVHAGAGWRSVDAMRAPAGFDVVFVLLGTNDEIHHVDPLTYRANIDRLARRGDVCVIVTPWGRTGLAATWSDEPHLPYVANALRAALDNGCAFVDLTNVSSDGMSFDGVHPTSTGHAVIAMHIIDGMRPR